MKIKKEEKELNKKDEIKIKENEEKFKKEGNEKVKENNLLYSIYLIRNEDNKKEKEIKEYKLEKININKDRIKL